ncbi:ATP-NAD kinase family protein [Pectobacterium betavasculorum]|uniref:ATP-NAD kinase family protein n=1 Tax=Pectobacterium betavasculorum TaxID=55207 RepID=UPI00068EE4CB|nr:NAD(+)/NADH kinase [Pectobacterium betavasculorum]
MSEPVNSATNGSSVSPGWVGIIANPVSARDIRRVVGHAGSLTLAERANLIFRLLAALGTAGIVDVRMMPDREGLQAILTRILAQRHTILLPRLSWLPLGVSATVNDTLQAARMMRTGGASAIVVLGGDGTHRAVAKACGNVPIAGISTGTNNAWPELREPTIVGLAAGLYASGKIPDNQALRWNKRLDIAINTGHPDARHDIAIVDAAILAEQFIGARSVWRPEQLSQLYLCFAEPHTVGLSSIGGLLMPLSRQSPGGLSITFGSGAGTLLAPLAPGLLHRVAIARWQRIEHGAASALLLRQGVIALDGEREMMFGPQDSVRIALRERAFRSIDINACLRYAAENELFWAATSGSSGPL